MKRLIAALLAVGLVTAGVLALSGVQAGATSRPHTLQVGTMTLARDTDLKSGEIVGVKGTGFIPNVKLYLLECNLDAADSATIDACDLTTANVGNVVVNASGDFSVDQTIATGNINSTGAGATYSFCPETGAQVAAGVTCALIALDYEDSPIREVAITPLWFTPPPLKISVKKSGKDYDATITESGSYKKGTVGGFGFVGNSEANGKGTDLCQGNSDGTTTWPTAGFPLCKSSIGEVVKIYVGGKLVHSERVATTVGNPGGFTYKLKNVKAGLHYVKVVGATTGTTLFGKFKVK